MSITINAKGTSVPYFRLGKNGSTLYQGIDDPSETYDIRDGDYWLSPTSLNIWSANSWKAPDIAGINFTGNSISTTNGEDLVLAANGINSKIVFSGDVGPGIITSTSSQNLYIDPTLGGGSNLILIDNQWPSTDGNGRQVLTTDGNGILSFSYVDRIGESGLTTTSTSGFAYLPVVNGEPTGVPSAITGYSPMVVDSNNSKIWIYIGNAWKSATLN